MSRQLRERRGVQESDRQDRAQRQRLLLARASRQVMEHCGDIVTMSTGVHDSLVTDAGWSLDDYERWLRETLINALLRSE
ncbi:hypothetical protein [Saccharopolyspora taberi]|uniref:Uncharacterized protein n=1 Tax=Saccharopolyspora taberi TaxID=60895 RepID=A0ABN3VEF4_9PSEU